MLSDACKKAKLGFGLYFSNPDWHFPKSIDVSHAERFRIVIFSPLMAPSLKSTHRDCTRRSLFFCKRPIFQLSAYKLSPGVHTSPWTGEILTDKQCSGLIGRRYKIALRVWIKLCPFGPVGTTYMMGNWHECRSLSKKTGILHRLLFETNLLIERPKSNDCRLSKDIDIPFLNVSVGPVHCFHLWPRSLIVCIQLKPPNVNRVFDCVLCCNISFIYRLILRSESEGSWPTFILISRIPDVVVNSGSWWSMIAQRKPRGVRSHQRGSTIHIVNPTSIGCRYTFPRCLFFESFCRVQIWQPLIDDWTWQKSLYEDGVLIAWTLNVRVIGFVCCIQSLVDVIHMT